MTESLPAIWAHCEIGEVADVVGGATPSTRDPSNFAGGEGIPWITPADLSGYRNVYIERGRRNLSAKGFAACSAAMMPTGAVLFSSRAPIGYVAIAANPVCTNQGFKSFVPPDGIDSRFLYYYLRFIKPAAEARATGTTFKELSGKAASRLPLLLAPSNEQRRIADKLDAVLARLDACRERLDRVPAILKRFRQSVLAAATSGKLTKDWREEREVGPWERVALGQVATRFDYGSSRKSSNSGAVPVLRMGNIQDGRLDWTDLVFTSDAQEIEKYRLLPGDVLFNRTNSPELVGKTAVFAGERDAVHAGYLIRVRCSERVIPEFLNYCLNSPAGRQYCWEVKSDGVSQSNINARKLRAFTFSLPSPEEQFEIVRRSELLLACADRAEEAHSASNRFVDHLVPAVLAQAFRGDLVPQYPDDEPASVLLERLRAERAGRSMKVRRPGGGHRARTGRKSEVSMLNRNEIDEKHLSSILKERGPLTAESLWSASQLGIDDFYDQLKDEEARGLLVEKRSAEATSARMLEAAA